MACITKFNMALTIAQHNRLHNKMATTIAQQNGCNSSQDYTATWW